MNLTPTADEPKSDGAGAGRFLVEAEQAPFGLDGAVLEPSVREGLRRFVATLDPRVTGALGQLLKAIASKRFLNLWGPPGSGKTFIARLIAGELERPLLCMQLGQLTSKFMGDTEKHLSAVFAEARERQAVFFVDEADALLSRRVAGPDGHGAARNAILDHVIELLNGHDGVVIFATNRLESYDLAIERRLVNLHVPAPGEETRRALWELYLAQAPISPVPDAAWIRRLDAVVSRCRAARDPERPFTAADMGTIIVAAVADAASGSSETLCSISRAHVKAALDRHLAGMEAALRRRRGSEDPLRAAESLVRATFTEDQALLRAIQDIRAQADASSGTDDVSRARASRLHQKSGELAVTTLLRRVKLHVESGVAEELSERTLRRLAEMLPRADSPSSNESRTSESGGS